MTEQGRSNSPPNDGSESGYSVTRPILQSIELQNDSGYARNPKKSSLLSSLKTLTALSVLTSVLPIVEWLPRYDLRNNLVGDLISGFTVAVMHIPQGMAYGILALVTPEVGLYMAFYPVLVYLLLGTSRHASLGTFAVISIMVSKTVQTHATFETGQVANITTTTAAIMPDTHTPMEVVTALSLMVGILHLIMFVCRMGALSSLLSEPLVSGFTTGAAVHVFVNQLKDILGIHVLRFRGAFKIVYALVDLFSKLGESNTTAVILSAILITLMVVNNELLKPRVAKLCRFPIPIELMVVIGGTLLSQYMHLGERYDVKLVGAIPTGLPAPQVPKVRLLYIILGDALAIAIVSYAVLMSVAKTFAKKHCYEVRPNQELLATGLANIVGSFFSCMPTGCALARSVIQEQTGGKTQIASLISASLIVLVILFIGPFFEVLPRCVLSSIIVVALKTMLFQVQNLKRFFRQDPLDAFTWIVTFLAVILIDIDIGLLFGVAMAMVCLYLRGLKAHSCSVGVLPGTEIYVDLKSHAKATRIVGLEIWRYSGCINFTSSAGVKKKLYEALEEDKQRNTAKTRTPQESDSNERKPLTVVEGRATGVIFDISCVPRIDVAACKSLLEIKSELRRKGANFVLAGANDKVYDILMHVFLMQRDQIDSYVSVHDAVLAMQSAKPAAVAMVTFE